MGGCVSRPNESDIREEAPEAPDTCSKNPQVENAATQEEKKDEVQEKEAPLVDISDTKAPEGEKKEDAASVEPAAAATAAATEDPKPLPQEEAKAPEAEVAVVAAEKAVEPEAKPAQTEAEKPKDQTDAPLVTV